MTLTKFDIGMALFNMRIQCVPGSGPGDASFEVASDMAERILSNVAPEDYESTKRTIDEIFPQRELFNNRTRLQAALTSVAAILANASPEDREFVRERINCMLGSAGAIPSNNEGEPCA